MLFRVPFWVAALLLLAIIYLVLVVCGQARFRIWNTFFLALQFSLSALSILVFIWWIIKGNNFLFSYGILSKIVKPVEAISRPEEAAFFLESVQNSQGSWNALNTAILNVTGLIGLSNIPLVWLYKEHSKTTFGKEGLALIRYRWGTTYTLSLIVHFVCTVLCVFTTNLNAREPAWCTFLAVVTGFFIQLYICFAITLNKKRKNETALELWNEDIRKAQKDETQLLKILEKMIKSMSDLDTRNNDKYRNQLNIALNALLEAEYCIKKAGIKIISSYVKNISYVFSCVKEIVPKEEETDIESELLSCLSEQNKEDDNATQKLTVLQDMLACGYLRSLYQQYCVNEKPLKTSVEMIIRKVKEHIRELKYYEEKITVKTGVRENTYTEVLEKIKLYAVLLEWYFFLNGKSDVPSECPEISKKSLYGKNIFSGMVSSIVNDFDILDDAENETKPDKVYDKCFREEKRG